MPTSAIWSWLESAGSHAIAAEEGERRQSSGGPGSGSREMLVADHKMKYLTAPS